MAKRFYKDVRVEAEGSGFAVLLDGRVLKTPGKQDLAFESEARAKLVAAEWLTQGEEILPDTMPCTRLMNVACELTPPRRPQLVKEFRSYCNTDLLCYRSKSPQDLTARQEKTWQPILDWAAQTHGIALSVTTGLSTPQNDSSLSAAMRYASGLSHVDLTLLLHFTASFGSSILALALMEGHLDIEAAYAASRLDEDFQNERWGEDEEAVLRAQNIGQELAVLAALIGE